MHTQQQTLPHILSIAGSDSGGGAGVQADLKTMAAHGCYGLSVITALTAQNTQGVFAIHGPPAAFVAEQLKVVLDDIPIHAAKTGMLFSAEIIEALAELLQDKSFPLVVDPVSVSQSGHALLEPEALKALRTRMLPLADLLTPNKPEAEALADMSIGSKEDMKAAGQTLMNMGAKAVLIKGGHFAREIMGGTGMMDWLFLPDGTFVELPQPFIDTKHTHGTGCTLSAAIASNLGLGLSMLDAVKAAQAYLNLALAEGFAVGGGCSPPNHLHPTLPCSKEARQKGFGPAD
jgi:hydroxymethylpyrimidine/phosphomethylpyrimidine kinase